MKQKKKPPHTCMHYIITNSISFEAAQPLGVQSRRRLRKRNINTNTFNIELLRLRIHVIAGSTGHQLEVNIIIQANVAQRATTLMRCITSALVELPK